VALTRARPIAGDWQLGVQTSDAIRAVLTRQAQRWLAQECYEMRRLISQGEGGQRSLDLKLAAGGFIDIEFLAQYLLLRHAYAEPSLVCGSPFLVIGAAARCGMLGSSDARIYWTHTGFLRM